MIYLRTSTETLNWKLTKESRQRMIFKLEISKFHLKMLVEFSKFVI